MEIGVSTSSFYPLLTEKSLELVGKNGVGITEVFFNAASELESGFIKELKKIRDFYGLRIKSVHPTMSLAESFMLFSAYDRRKQEGFDSFRRYGEIANELGADFIILHGGKPNGILSDTQYFERFCEISEASIKNGGILLQENVAKYRAGNLDFLKKMRDYLKDDAKFCLDIKQSVRGGYSPFEALEQLGKNIKHLHISDSNSEKDCLLPLHGNFDFKSFLNKAESMGYDGVALIEVYSDAYEDYSEIFDSYRNIVKIL